MVKEVKGQQSFQSAGTVSARVLGPTDVDILQSHNTNPPKRREQWLQVKTEAAGLVLP